jgi:hypothetical protein
MQKLNSYVSAIVVDNIIFIFSTERTDLMCYIKI